MATKHDGNDCYTKAGDHEPIFTLRAQDMTAAATVRFWFIVNVYLRRRLKKGDDAGHALAAIEEIIDTVVSMMRRDPIENPEKLLGALETASKMELWPEQQKVAD